MPTRPRSHPYPLPECNKFCDQLTVRPTDDAPQSQACINMYVCIIQAVGRWHVVNVTQCAMGGGEKFNGIKILCTQKQRQQQPQK